ncbi:MAG TPA: MFS transporter, partial [Candidatus Limnocylindria bacterium]|nr:MFS transporter [Candidatus Limnocylindria bacterium]
GASPAIGGAGPGLFAAAMFAGRSLGQLLSRRFAERELLVGSGLLAAAGIALAAWSPTAEAALLGLVVAGSGVSLAAPALFSRAGRLAGDASRGAAISTLTTMGYMGFVIGPPIVGFIAGLSDLRMSFTALAVLALGLAAAARLAIPPGKPAFELEEELPPVARA